MESQLNNFQKIQKKLLIYFWISEIPKDNDMASY